MKPPAGMHDWGKTQAPQRAALGRFGFCALLACLPVALFVANAQVLGPVKGFKLADPHAPPNEGQLKSLLQAETAFRLPDGKVALTNALLDTFRENGQRDLVAQTTYALCDPDAHSASSPGPLKAATADGKFSIIGEGFFWQQTNATLVISNKVFTEVQPDLKIRSDQLVYWADLGLGIYRGHVRLQQGTNWTLTASTLTFKLPRTERQLQEVTADTNVVVESATMKATGEHAVYAADTGLMRMTGNPWWQADQKLGRGDELVIDRTNKIFQANGHAWLRLPGQGLGTGGFLFNSNATAPRSLGSTNQFIEVRCNRYEVQTNSAVFRGNVRLSQRFGSQVRGTMTCGLMLANFAGTNELQSLVAQTNVVIEQDLNRFTGGKAVYVGTNGILKLTEKPTWRSGDNWGNGDTIWVNQAQNEMIVHGNASLHRPANELAVSGLRGVSTNTRPQIKKSGPQYADIFCDRYALRASNSVFQGGVYVTHPQMNWSAETVTVLSPAPETKVLIAEQGVVFDVLDGEGGKVHGEGDKAFYTNTVQSWSTNGVKTTITNDLLRLIGEPAKLIREKVPTNSNDIVRGPSRGPAKSARLAGTNWADFFTYDRFNDRLSTGPNYRIEGVAPASQTNLLAPPKIKLKK